MKLKLKSRKEETIYNRKDSRQRITLTCRIHFISFSPGSCQMRKVPQPCTASHSRLRTRAKQHRQKCSGTVSTFKVAVAPGWSLHRIVARQVQTGSYGL